MQHHFLRSPYTLYPVQPIWHDKRWDYWPSIRYRKDCLCICFPVSKEKKDEKKKTVPAIHPYKGKVIDISV